MKVVHRHSSHTFRQSTSLFLPTAEAETKQDPSRDSNESNNNDTEKKSKKKQKIGAVSAAPPAALLKRYWAHPQSELTH